MVLGNHQYQREYGATGNGGTVVPKRKSPMSSVTPTVGLWSQLELTSITWYQQRALPGSVARSRTCLYPLSLSTSLFCSVQACRRKIGRREIGLRTGSETTNTQTAWYHHSPSLVLCAKLCYAAQ
eukprot:924737-Rhodomonas_salina.5